MPETLDNGQWVYYHGSVTNRHGYMRVVNNHPPYSKISDDDTVRYVLQYSPAFRGYLENVRPNSFSIISIFSGLQISDQFHQYSDDHPTATANPE